jgi:hypothetical protein
VTELIHPHKVRNNPGHFGTKKGWEGSHPRPVEGPAAEAPGPPGGGLDGVDLAV